MTNWKMCKRKAAWIDLRKLFQICLERLRESWQISGYSVFWLRFEPSAYGLQARNLTTWENVFCSWYLCDIDSITCKVTRRCWFLVAVFLYIEYTNVSVYNTTIYFIYIK